jgi:hypothetical protein
MNTKSDEEIWFRFFDSVLALKTKLDKKPEHKPAIEAFNKMINEIFQEISKNISIEKLAQSID